MGSMVNVLYHNSNTDIHLQVQGFQGYIMCFRVSDTYTDRDQRTRLAKLCKGCALTRAILPGYMDL